MRSTLTKSKTGSVSGGNFPFQQEKKLIPIQSEPVMIQMNRAINQTRSGFAPLKHGQHKGNTRTLFYL